MTTPTTETADRATGVSRSELDVLIEPHLDAALGALDGPAPLLSGMARYHFGLADERLRPHPADPAAVGKRMRPRIAILCCQAAGGEAKVAAPLAAAVELLHNFTLVHDDIQDRSQNRHHRPTIWSLWGDGQAINAGDALFAAAHLVLYRLQETGSPDGLVMRLAEAFDRMSIEIVAGQVLDLGFEGRSSVTTDDYLTMIAGKTAAIVRFAAWAGALLGGAAADQAEHFGTFGRALGLGFQVRDDLLGIWGSPAATGKAATDDIRRRKQSLPILLLRDCAADADRAELRALYAQPAIDDAGITRVLALLDHYDVRAGVEARVAALHDEARAALAVATGLDHDHDLAVRALLALVDSLSGRSG